MNLRVWNVIPALLVKTCHHFSTRIKEHTLTDQNSYVFKHLNNSTNCKNHYTPNCFKILDLAKTLACSNWKKLFTSKIDNQN